MRLPGEDILASDFLSSLTLGENLAGASTPVPVYQAAADGKAYKALADDATKIDFSGFCITTANADAAGWIVNDGLVGGFAGLTPGARYYLQDDGTIGTAKGTYEILVGKARSASVLKIITEDRPDERWREQTLQIYPSTSIDLCIGYDFAFDENCENLFLAIVFFTSGSTKFYLERYAKDKKTGIFRYTGYVEVEAIVYGPVGVTCYGGYVYVIYQTNVGVQTCKRYDLDLTNQTSITISSGVSAETQGLTNVGSDFYTINGDSSHTNGGHYTLSGTTLTRLEVISNITGAFQYGQYMSGLSDDGSNLIFCYGGSSEKNSKAYYNVTTIKKAPLAGGASSALVGASDIWALNGYFHMGIFKYGSQYVHMSLIAEVWNDSMNGRYIRMTKLSL